MAFDTTVPPKLLKTQLWFADVITRPLENENDLVPSPRHLKLQQEAPSYITPGQKLKPHERIYIYNQQYWWRLLNCLQESFPLVTRLFGYNDFNQMIAIPYLCKYPPNHWSLNFLGDLIPQWIQEHYKEQDKLLVHLSAQVDLAYQASFVAATLPSILVEDISPLLKQRLLLQPSIHLFQMDKNLFTFREEFLTQDVAYWLQNDFPKLPKGKTLYFILFRSPKNFVHWQEISLGEFSLLNLIREGFSVEQACQRLQKQNDGAYEEALSGVESWFSDWVFRGWLSV